VNPDEGYPLLLRGSATETLASFPEVATSENNAPVIIEIAVVVTDEESSKYWERIIFGRIDLEKDRKFKLVTECLGYDVADRYLVSGLSNCQLSAEELAAVRKDWSEAINGWGLLADSEAAKAFRAVCNQLIPEHAPFEAYRMRRVAIVVSG
jgi:hypothetical protein